jgi:predicted TIM-barrel fold metal-dependent hydrolase
MHIVDIGTLFGVRPAIDQATVDSPAHAGEMARAEKLDLSADTLLRVLAHNGVAEALTCSLKAIQFNFAAGNNETWALCQTHPNLHPVAVVDPRQYPDCLAEVERCAAKGFVAFRLWREYQGWAIASQSFKHLLRAISRTGKPTIVHTPAAGDATALLDIAGEWDLAVVLASITYSTMAEALAVMVDAPRFYLEAHRVALPGEVEVMVEAVGAERIMFGSWAPLFSQRPSMDMVLESEIGLQDQARILSGNARRVFRLMPLADREER